MVACSIQNSKNVQWQKRPVELYVITMLHFVVVRYTTTLPTPPWLLQ